MRIISKKKIEKIKSSLAKKGAKNFILMSSSPFYDSNIEYLTGLRQERDTAFACLIFSNNKSTLVVSPLDYDQAVAEATADEIIQIRKTRLSDIIKEHLGKSKTLGINESLFSMRLAKRLHGKKLIDIEDILLDSRAIKEPKELECIEKACSIANNGVKIIENNISKTKSCREMNIILESEMMRRGADEMSFKTLITSGKRGLWIHPYPSVQEGNFSNMGLIDFGVRYKGYCSDVTVPFTKGKITEKQKLILRTVKEAYTNAIAKLDVGVNANEVFDVADNIITKNGFVFKHSLGHGIGLDVHENPNLSPKPQDKKILKVWKPTELKENMVFTIEPGVYEHAGGIRLENDFVLTRNGPKQLTKARVLEL